MEFARIAIIACIVVGFSADSAFSQRAERPKPGGPLRYDEDWSLLRSPSKREEQWWEPFKFIPLDLAGDNFVTLGNEFRTRYEFLKHPNWGEEETDEDGYVWLRMLPTADFHLSDSLRLFGELILAPSAGVDPRPSGIDDDVIDILQAFVEVELADAARLRAGRQVIEIGSGRLVSTRYGVNVLQSFDTVELQLGNVQNSLRLLYGRPVDAQVGAFNDDWSRTRQGWTFYWSRDLVDVGIASSDASSLDLYYMGFENQQAVFDQGTGSEQRQTFAGRLHGKSERLRWDHELFIQLGQFADTQIRAWSLATLFGYRPRCTNLDLELTLQFNTISGDDDRSDNVLGTFNPMFPKLKYFGEPGVVAPANLFDLNPGISVRVSEEVTFKGDVMFLWRYSTDDGLYGAGGRLLRSGAGSDARYIATQYELGFELELSDNWNCNAFAATLPAGRFIRETGASDAISFVGLETSLVF